MNFLTRLPLLAGALILAFSPTPQAAAAPGDLDTGFDPGAGASGLVFSAAVQADGKVIIGGDFTSVGGVARSRIARLNADGSLDTGFDPGANNVVYSTALQADGKVIIGGGFTTVGGVARNRIARLNADGSLDTGFDPGANNAVLSAALQADGKVIIGGFFTTVGGVARSRIARLNADGSPDTGFDPGAGANSLVFSAAVQADGKVIIGGDFTTVGGVARNRIARLNADGSPDTGFDPGAGANNTVLSTALQADGKVVIGGLFATVGGTARNRIARLNADGSLDTGFDPGTGANGDVNSTALQADGKVIIGGDFTTVGGVARNRIARLNADGSLDTGFDPGANNVVYCAALQADGKVIIGGGFTTVGGVARSRIARLDNGAATGSLTVPSLSKVQWLRGGTAPEATRATFEYSTNGGSTWKSLGAGKRISGGWEITGVKIPARAKIRARAFTSGGLYNGSSGIVEAFATAPASTIQDTWTVWYQKADSDFAAYAAIGDFNFANAFYYYNKAIGDYLFHTAYGRTAEAYYWFHIWVGVYHYYYFQIIPNSTLPYFYLFQWYAYGFYHYYLFLGDTNSANAKFNEYWTQALGFL